MSNDAPPHACLADFGFTTTVLDPGQELSCSAQFGGGTKPFMAPELLAPDVFGKKGSTPTPQADIYAFGSVVFQVCRQNHEIGGFCISFLQVLTGEFPFCGVHPEAVSIIVAHNGKRPPKPENASAIGFSDSLWGFTQRCWDSKMELRPEAGEVVTHFGEAAANWDGLMPPCVRVRRVASTSDEDTSDSTKDGEFEILILPWY